MKDIIPQEIIEQKILLIRGHKVMLDRDLAELYGVTTGNLNKALTGLFTKDKLSMWIACVFSMRFHILPTTSVN